MNTLSHEQRRAVVEVLAGSKSYDSLDGAAQAVVREIWDGRIAHASEGLDLAEEFREAGILGWVSTDADGDVVIES